MLSTRKIGHAPNLWVPVVWDMQSSIGGYGDAYHVPVHFLPGSVGIKAGKSVVGSPEGMPFWKSKNTT